jgi:hypothetical protein
VALRKIEGDERGSLDEVGRERRVNWKKEGEDAN